MARRRETEINFRLEPGQLPNSPLRPGSSGVWGAQALQSGPPMNLPRWLRFQPSEVCQALWGASAGMLIRWAVRRHTGLIYCPTPLAYLSRLDSNFAGVWAADAGRERRMDGEAGWRVGENRTSRTRGLEAWAIYRKPGSSPLLSGMP